MTTTHRVRNLVWYELDAPEGGRRIAGWKRTVAVDQDDLTVFLSVGLLTKEGQFLLFSGMFGCHEMYFFRKHAYISTDWLAKEFPEKAEMLGEYASKVREFHSQQ